MYSHLQYIKMCPWTVYHFHNFTDKQTTFTITIEYLFILITLMKLMQLLHLLAIENSPQNLKHVKVNLSGLVYCAIPGRAEGNIYPLPWQTSSSLAVIRALQTDRLAISEFVCQGLKTNMLRHFTQELSGYYILILYCILVLL